MNWPCLLNTLWEVACWREASAFRRGTREVARTQSELLNGILQRNRETEFGRAHRFSAMRSVEDFQKAVPLSSHSDYVGEIGRITAGAEGVLTRGRVRLLQPTSGTSGGEKLIPYTDALRREFQRAIAVWVVDLLQNHPRVRRGRAYWSVSPAGMSRRRSPCGIPIGFDHDVDYLGRWLRPLIESLLVVPSAVAQLGDIESFRYCSLFHLLAADDLALISIWSPTFLTSLLNSLEAWQDRLCRDLKRGFPDPPMPVPATMVKQLSSSCRGNPTRAETLQALFRATLPLRETLRHIWPRLSLISCWTDASAACYVPELVSLYPHVEIQAKGLLATEGCVSVPLTGRPGAALAIRSHFFEFQSIEDTNDIRLAHNLEIGGRYRVVLTTGGGLYRYQLRDEVLVTGFENQCPLLRFIGRTDAVSDCVGEKLAEPHVRSVLQRLFDQGRTSPAFMLVVPVVGKPTRYRLYVQGPDMWEDSCEKCEWTKRLEAGLCENPHYLYARQLGQLGPAEVSVLDPCGEPARTVFERQSLARGRRLGNIKPEVLDAWAGWANVLDTISRTTPSPRREP